MLTVKDLNDIMPDLKLVQVDYEVEDINEMYGTDYGCFFVEEIDGEYTTIYGVYNNIPYNDMEVYEVITMFPIIEKDI